MIIQIYIHKKGIDSVRNLFIETENEWLIMKLQDCTDYSSINNVLKQHKSDYTEAKHTLTPNLVIDISRIMDANIRKMKKAFGGRKARY